MKCHNCDKEMKSKVRDYEYVESGLKNVVLKGITVHECKHCGEVLPEIRNIKQIHQWIAEYLLKKQGALTGPEFRFLRKAMGKSAKETAECLAVNPVTISRWENNEKRSGRSRTGFLGWHLFSTRRRRGRSPRQSCWSLRARLWAAQ